MMPFTVEYEIDVNNQIINVNSSWNVFALENKAAHLLDDKILNRTLFDFITNSEIQELWKSIIGHVRENKSPLQFTYRCDSSTHKRYMDMVITNVDDKVNFKSTILKTEQCQELILFDPELRRTNNFITVCSWCKRVKTDTQHWDEVENAVKKLGLFVSDLFPEISHGICPQCNETIWNKYLAKHNH